MPATEAGPGWSLRGRLLALFIVVLCGLMVAGTAFMYRETQQSSQQIYDDSLRVSGQLLLQLAEHEMEEHGPTLGATLLERETTLGPYQLEFQVWTADRRSAYRTAKTPVTPFLPIDSAGFGWTRVNGQLWRAYAVWNEDHQLQLQIAESLAYRQRLPTAILWRLCGAIAVLLLAGSLVAWWIIQRSFRSMRGVARAVGARSPADLSPIEAGQVPQEVTPLVHALNRLLDQVRGAFANERRFTADAAHELRTPLAAIRANAQVMQNARTPEESREAASDLLTAVDRGGRLVKQLLALARLDARGGQGAPSASVDLAQLVEAQQLEQQDFAVERGIALEVQPGAAEATGDRVLLAVLLRNLVDNAIRYAGRGATVTLASRMVDGRAELAVSDNGPGISPENRARIFERFYRVNESADVGSGLGLSIVARIAELHQGEMLVREGPGGRGVEFVLRFPAAR